RCGEEGSRVALVLRGHRHRRGVEATEGGRVQAREIVEPRNAAALEALSPPNALKPLDSHTAEYKIRNVADINTLLENLSDLQHSGAVAKTFGPHIHPVQHRQKKIRHGGVFPQVDVPACPQATIPLANYQNRQFFMRMAIAVGNSSSVQDHRMIE